jgi:hypothetical protein
MWFTGFLRGFPLRFDLSELVKYQITYAPKLMVWHCTEMLLSNR